MKKLFEIITTFLCFNSVTPVLMYYIYDDNPTIGFVGVDNVVGEYVTGYTAPKKSFTPSYGSRFQKFTNERVVDSHFKLMKSPSRYGHPTLMDRNAAQRRSDHRMTAPPQGWQSSNKQMITSNRQVQMPQQNQQLQQQQHPQQQQQQHPQQQQQQHPQQQQLQQQQQMHNSMQQQQKMQQQLPQQQQHQRQIQQQQQHQPQQRQVIPQANNLPRAFPNKASKQSHTVDSKRIDSQHHKDLSKKDNNIPPVRPKAVNADYTSPIKQRPRSSNSVYEPKPSFVQMNVRKTQILQDPQKLVRLNNNIQLKAASVLGSQNERQRIPTSMIMDKTLHKSNGLTDRNSQAMSQVLNDITQQVSERRHNKRENRVLDSKISFDNYGKEKHNYVSDNIKKFISNKTDKKHTNNVEIGNVESHEENLERKETPYALFYRMNPESLDQQEAFVFMRSVDPKSTQNVKSTKKQHISDFSLRETLNRRSNNHGKRLQKMKLLNNSGTNSITGNK